MQSAAGHSDNKDLVGQRKFLITLDKTEMQVKQSHDMTEQVPKSQLFHTKFSKLHDKTDLDTLVPIPLGFFNPRKKNDDPKKTKTFKFGKCTDLLRHPEESRTLLNQTVSGVRA